MHDEEHGRRRPRLRRSLAVLALAAVTATACGSDTAPAPTGEPTAATGNAATPGGAYPATIEHNYGSTEITEAPGRVVSVGYTDQDALLALGVTPVAVREFFGEQPDATWPWAQDELGDAEPEVLDVAELNFERIAALQPDLIVGVSSGMTEDDYEQLSEIAPTISRPDEYVDYGVPWQDQTRVIGRALGREDQAEEVVAEVEGRFDQARAEHPELEDATVIVARPSTEPGQFFLFGPEDSRSRFMTSLGFGIPPQVAELASDSFIATISGEQLDLLDTADLVVWNVDTPADRELVERDPIYPQLAVAREGRDLFLDEETNAALSFGTVLSIPFLLDELVPELAGTVAGD